ncbi:hypothetical protein DDV21_009340 [Streptococcus chenjunshii]|uniref:Uncharacterized protein n=1 Tax=Streptococcus chenjunshii TaxID=2173853 RepID=A0A372KIS7_9STRE|nr:hypothetical protein DDV21_009340 [Streptococcus chenjunshii]RFU50555.1 hypothetical protein DDV22_08105 [Streptococcus chenjunshii]RFU52150.1 hypothetical protein DDV23_11210 [Streptococcus chenjunshii]
MRSAAKTTKPSDGYGWLKLKSALGRTGSFFPQRLGRVQVRQDIKTAKTAKQRNGKPVISDFVCTPLPEQLKVLPSKPFYK